MLAPNLNFGPETVKLMGNVCDDAMRELFAKYFYPTLEHETEIKRRIAQRVMSGIVDGERDPLRLRQFALKEIDA